MQKKFLQMKRNQLKNKRLRNLAVKTARFFCDISLLENQMKNKEYEDYMKKSGRISKITDRELFA